MIESNTTSRPRLRIRAEPRSSPGLPQPADDLTVPLPPSQSRRRRAGLLSPGRGMRRRASQPLKSSGGFGWAYTSGFPGIPTGTTVTRRELVVVDVVRELDRAAHDRSVRARVVRELHGALREEAALELCVVLDVGSRFRLPPGPPLPSVTIVRSSRIRVPGGEVAVGAGDAAAQLRRVVDQQRPGEVEGRLAVVLIQRAVRDVRAAVDEDRAGDGERLRGVVPGKLAARGAGRPDTARVGARRGSG